jgi:hypothetical protein
VSVHVCRCTTLAHFADECRCSLPRAPGQAFGNFQWCCNTVTPRLRINRHIDLGKVAFSAVR